MPEEAAEEEGAEYVPLVVAVRKPDEAAEEPVPIGWEAEVVIDPAVPELLEAEEPVWDAAEEVAEEDAEEETVTPADLQ